MSFFKQCSVVAVVCLGLLLSHHAQACTVFAAVGPEDVAGAGALIAKVRDERAAVQTVKFMQHDTGYAFVGLFVGPKERFNMGVNEMGFVVFRTTAGSVPKDVRRQSVRFKSEDGLSGHEFLIRNCSSVDEALAQKAVFEHEPTNYMLADARKIAFVEVMPGGRHAVIVKDRGTLAHTNHYVTDAALADNIKIGKSSRARFARIQELLEKSPRPLKMDDFIAFTRDRNDGPNNSIFRIGSPNAKITTLSSMVVYLPENAAPVMEFAWRPNPADPKRWLRQRLSFPTH